MEWLQTNAWVLVLVVMVIALIILGFIVFIFKKVDLIAKNTVENSLLIKSSYGVNTKTSSSNLSITIYNPNYRDIQINKAGFIYLNQEINYFDQMFEAYGSDGRLLIRPRNSISLLTSIDSLEKIVLENLEDNKNKVGKVYNLIIDSVGTQKISYNKPLTKLLKKREKERKIRAKRQLNILKIEAYKSTHNGKVPLTQKFFDIFRKVKLVKIEITNNDEIKNINKEIVKEPEENVEVMSKTDTKKEVKEKVENKEEK